MVTFARLAKHFGDFGYGYSSFCYGYFCEVSKTRRSHLSQIKAFAMVTFVRLAKLKGASDSFVRLAKQFC